MSKITTALWKGVKHGVTAGLVSAAVAVKTGATLKEVPAYFALGFLAGIGINVHAIKNA